ncbi:hypothetical protein GCM10020366_05900 [Saccharopolyspora gregorii]|uniref:Uncharacterized protein n=1 Tax=Saccharopolyspora gregorii TaxID=33914 RepID=A0ABP6RKW6_9PSEU
MPHLFDVSFVMLVPLVYAVAKRTGSHLLFVGLPMAAGLYVSHGLLPPHPAPTLAVAAYDANTGLTIFYGLLIAIPVMVPGGAPDRAVRSPGGGAHGPPAHLALAMPSTSSAVSSCSRVSLPESTWPRSRTTSRMVRRSLRACFAIEAASS